MRTKKVVGAMGAMTVLVVVGLAGECLGMSERQKSLADMVDRHAKEVLEAERWIWAHPQTGFTEWQANEYLSKRFEALGYKLKMAGNIPGFYADLDTGRPGPKVCVLGELDALDIPGHPEAVNGIAHLCGHHAQCAAMLGIAAALKEPGALDGLSGSVRQCSCRRRNWCRCPSGTNCGPRGRSVISAASPSSCIAVTLTASTW